MLRNCQHIKLLLVQFTPYESLSITATEEARSWAFNYIDKDDKIHGFAKTDIRMDYNLNHGLSINLSINNLFDKSYQYTKGYIEEGRNYWLGIEYNY